MSKKKIFSYSTAIYIFCICSTAVQETEQEVERGGGEMPEGKKNHGGSTQYL
jgi:hypothetical protein